MNEPPFMHEIGDIFIFDTRVNQKVAISFIILACVFGQKLMPFTSACKMSSDFKLSLFKSLCKFRRLILEIFDWRILNSFTYQ